MTATHSILLDAISAALPDCDRATLEKCLPEFLTTIGTVARARKRSPAPPRVIIHPDLSEERFDE